jgi:hypothetical protein
MRDKWDQIAEAMWEDYQSILDDRIADEDMEDDNELFDDDIYS